MTEVVSVKFKNRGKTYFFSPGGLQIPDEAQVVVETAKGLELVECVKGNHYVLDGRVVQPLRPVLRLASAEDLRVAAQCKVREKEAFSICEKKIAQRGLDMKLVDVECNFEGNKILFFFTSDGRVDFRDLVKDLASVFHTRIELRQIGVRDEAKMLGGLGICGRPFCCNLFLDGFQPVSTKMAKTQSLSLNPTKISGTCGRLMCCLRYEQDAYEDLVKTVPKNGTFVETPVGYGNVTQVNLLRRQVKVVLDSGDNTPRPFSADEVAAVPGGRPKAGEPLPHVLTLKEKPAEPEAPEADMWASPSLFGDSDEKTRPSATRSGWGSGAPSRAETEGDRPQGSGRRRSRHKKSSGGQGQGQRQGQGQGQGQRPASEASQKKPVLPKENAGGGDSQRQRRSRRKMPGEHTAQETRTDGGNQPRPPKPQNPPQPKPGASGGGNGGAPQNGEAKKSNNRRRRYGKPKSSGESGPKSES